MQSYERMLSTPTMKQHAEEVAVYLRDRCGLQIDVEGLNRP